jgi:single-strand DNA-binding protein
MSSFNKVILLGNLTRDPELIVLSSGQSVCKFSIAVNRKFSSQKNNGLNKEEIVFIDIVSFGKQADVINKYIFKGSPILVEGRLRMERWTNQKGEKRNKICVILENFQFIGRKKTLSLNDNKNNKQFSDNNSDFLNRNNHLSRNEESLSNNEIDDQKKNIDDDLLENQNNNPF